MLANHLLLFAILLPAIVTCFFTHQSPSSSSGVRLNRILLRRTSRTAIPMHITSGSSAPPTSTPRTVQQKEEDLPPRRSPPAGLAAAGVEIDLSKKFMTQMREADQSYGAGQNLGGYSPKGHNGGNNGDNVDYDYGFDNSIDMMMEMMKNTIRGEPGKDYPILSDIPITQFKCSDHQLPGYYADVETQCQVFHICQEDGRHDAFLCPNGTIFSQRHFVCVWWYEFDCMDSPAFYGLNAELYKEVEAIVESMPNGPADDADGFAAIDNAGGGSVPSYGQSPKQSMYPQQPQQQLMAPPMTTTSPMYYSNNGQQQQRSKPSSIPSYGYSNGKSNKNNNGKLTSRYEPTYGGSSSSTPSPIGQEVYETTPYNLDAALGEEIHSETPLIESLPLTTILPHVEKVVDMAIASRKTAPTSKSTYGFGTKKSNGGSRPSYGGTKGKSNKNGGGSLPSTTYGMANGSALPSPPTPTPTSSPSPPLSPASTVAARKNGFKPHQYQPSYGTKI
ncbi:hypothetical protein DERP_012711 [Dermatophagoides pteronyssinus]|uniref:Chitin-binding type-2 domain-containing protein n=1 Tax=Dermatophagoides pteronyssinus TaxID=6956 RepID=A0ABQ8JQC8_DERPT|nr:hypothetical protein DERP_012711 [Dermatophagoides pteronyssinus]